MVPTKIHQQNTPLFYEIDPELLRRVGPVPAVVYAVLLSHDDGGGGACIAYRVVAQEAGVGLNTAIRAIEKLIDDGLVKSEEQIQNNRQIANIYRYPTFSMPTQDGQVGLRKPAEGLEPKDTVGDFRCEGWLTTARFFLGGKDSPPLPEIWTGTGVSAAR